MPCVRFSVDSTWDSGWVNRPIRPKGAMRIIHSSDADTVRGNPDGDPTP
jgi:hypothetical protein